MTYTPLHLRSLARSVTNSPLAGNRYCEVTLSGTPVKIKSLYSPVEKISEKDGLPLGDVHRFVQFREDCLETAGVDRVKPGDTFTDWDGVTWQMISPLRKNNGMIRARLIDVQDQPTL